MCRDAHSISKQSSLYFGFFSSWESFRKFLLVGLQADAHVQALQLGGLQIDGQTFKELLRETPHVPKEAYGIHVPHLVLQNKTRRSHVCQKQFSSAYSDLWGHV